MVALVAALSCSTACKSSTPVPAPTVTVAAAPLPAVTVTATVTAPPAVDADVASYCAIERPYLDVQADGFLPSSSAGWDFPTNSAQLDAATRTSRARIDKLPSITEEWRSVLKETDAAVNAVDQDPAAPTTESLTALQRQLTNVRSYCNGTATPPPAGS